MKARVPWGLWVVLTLLVWGLFVPDRGLYQDDVSVMAARWTWAHAGKHIAERLDGMGL